MIPAVSLNGPLTNSRTYGEGNLPLKVVCVRTSVTIQPSCD